MLLLSIITINYNNIKGLKKTIQSVFAQTFTGYEYIVIDGGSTDGSKEIIEHHDAKFASWVSEKDNGIYHALNKGIAKATGEYLLFLNSGDVLANKEVLSSIGVEDFWEDIIAGNCLLDFGNQQTQKLHPIVIDFEYMYTNTLCHQSVFIKRSLFNKIGHYSEDYSICSDWYFFMEAFFRHNASYKNSPVVVAVYDMTGLSNNKDFAEKHLRERKFILDKFFNSECKLLEQYLLYKSKYNAIVLKPGIKQLLRLNQKLVKFFQLKI